VLEIFSSIQEKLNDTPHLLRLGRLFSETVLIDVDGEEVHLTFDREWTKHGGHAARFLFATVSRPSRTAALVTATR
jgi:hypothetical protein